MTASEIFVTIASIITAIMGGGTLITLFQLRNLNAKLSAETNKIKSDTDIEMFKAQIAAANELSNTMSQRLDILTKRLSEQEAEAKCQQMEAKLREQRLSRLEGFEKQNKNMRRMFNAVCDLVDRFIVIANRNISLRAALNVQEYPQIYDIDRTLVNEVADIDKKFIEIKREMTELDNELAES